jgi:hypothetical protein
MGKGLYKQFVELSQVDFKFNKYKYRMFSDCENIPIGHMLDPTLSLDVLGIPRYCDRYGECVGCDTKLKRGHHKEGKDYNRETIYSSVVITNLNVPEGLDLTIN